MTVVVIISGGKGSRLRSVTGQLPKGLTQVAGIPILEHQIKMAREQGFTEYKLCLGYGASSIMEYFGDGSNHGVRLEHIVEEEPLGTAGALQALTDQIREDFVVFYGDTWIDVDLKAFLNFHKEERATATLFVHPNNHPFDSDLVRVNESSLITDLLPSPHESDAPNPNLVSAALYVLSPRVFRYLERRKSDVAKDIIPKLLSSGEKVVGYRSVEYIKDMGTPDRLKQVEQDLKNGKINRLKERVAIFLDRDGVVTEDNGLISDPSAVQLIAGAAEAIRLINESGFLAVLVTNQSVVARNLCSFRELEVIHNTLESKLGELGAYLDRVYFCPHHPDSGYPEENRSLKIICNCRKPAPGMLFRAADDMKINLAKSIIVGDRDSDVQAGFSAGLSDCIKIKRNEPFALHREVIRLLEAGNC